MEAIKKQNVYCTFLLGDSEITLPLSAVQEVVNFPTENTRVPLSPEFIEGVFNLRGHIIPIVNVHFLLKKEGKPHKDSKVAIVNFHEIRIGLVFDSTHEILKVSDEDICNFDYFKGHKSVVKGALRLDGGKRILQVIDTEMLFSIETIPHIVSKIKITGQTGNNKAQEAKKKRQCISFMSHGFRFALNMDSFQEILAFQKLDESVVEYDYSAGILNLRGSVIPVIDFGKFLDPETQVSTELDNKKIIISRMGANLKIGLLVDSIEDIIPYFAEDVLKVPPMGKKREGFYSGVIEKNGEEAVIIDCELLKKDPDLLNIVEGHANLFKQAEENLTQKKKFVRQTFISFKVADIFSIPIGEIREIIDIPKDIMNTPGVKPHIKGIYNLRNQIVTIVDLRTLYNMPESENPSVQKVLIVENAKEKYGLVVDDVNEIFNINAEEKFPIPLAIAAKKDGVPTHDMKELVMICNKTTNTDQKMIVLDVRSILNRIVEAA